MAWAKKIVQFLLRKPLLWFISKLESAPQKKDVEAKLSMLYNALKDGNEKYGVQINLSTTDKLVVVSDVHKGKGNDADDFAGAAENYVAALYYYLLNGYSVIALGDIEELWENKMAEILATHEASVAVEAKFVAENRYYKVAGNHDLIWRTSPNFATYWLKKMYGVDIPIHEAVLATIVVNEQPLHLFFTHGHQGDKTSDGNKFSKWFVTNIWCKVQNFLSINPNAPSKDFLLRDKHNRMMYEWSERQLNTILITGHTHKPVFASKTLLDELKRRKLEAEKIGNIAEVELLSERINKELMSNITNEPYMPKLPTYFNAGCCCFSDGDITVLEIADGQVRLVKWYKQDEQTSRKPLQEINLSDIITQNFQMHY
jgi:UDP-2,3-diacylglucosamine pyrophosphatase LpxH